MWCPESYKYDKEAGSGTFDCYELEEICDWGFPPDTVHNCTSVEYSAHPDNADYCLDDFDPSTTGDLPYNAGCCEFSNVGGFYIYATEGVKVY